MSALRFARQLFVAAIFGASLGACSQGPQEVVAPAITATSSASSSAAAALPSAPEIVATKAELVRFGAVGLGSAPTFVAFPGDGQRIATSMGMAGAEVELFDSSGAAIGTFKPEIEQAVRAIDFSPDGTKLLVSLTGGPRRPAALVELSVPALTPLRTLTLPADPASSRFERGVEAHYTDSGEIVGVTEGALVVWGTSGEARRTITKLTAGAALGTSPSRRWLVVSTPDGIELRESAHLEKLVTQAKRSGPDKAELPSPRAFVSDDGALLFQDQGHVKLLPKGGAAIDLGAGRPLGLGPRQALVADVRRVRVVERTGAKTVAELQAADAWLSPSGTEMLAHTGADAANALSLLPVARLIDNSLVMHASTAVLAFTAHGSGVAVADRGELVIWDRATRAVRSRAPLPGKHDGARGMICDRDGALLVWLRDPDELVRYDGRTFESLGASLLAKPSAFAAPSGPIVVVGSEDTATSRGHLVIRDRHPSPFLWNALLPLSATQALSTGPSEDSRSDLGPGPLADRRGAPTKLPTAWLSRVDLWRAAPTGEVGGVLLTAEPKPQFSLRRVDASGVDAPCLLGARRPAYDTPMLTSPDGAEVALVLERDSDGHSRVLFADYARCSLRAVDVDADIEGLAYAPDGRSLALGLRDRSFAVLAVPESDARK